MQLLLYQGAYALLIPDLPQRVDLRVALCGIQLLQQHLLAFAQLPQAQHGFGPDAEVVEHAPLFAAQMARFVVDDAECANVVALGIAQRPAGVKADIRATGHQRVVGKTLVGGRIFNDEQVVAENGVTTKRNITRRLAHRQAHARFEPLAIQVDQRYQCNRHREQVLRNACNPVKRLFVRGVE